MRDTPNIRFKGFTDPWEQRKLYEVAEFNPKSELPNEFEYVDLESVVGTEMISHRTETKESAPSRAQRLAQTGDVFFQTVRPYQRNNYLFSKPDKNYVFSTGYAQMRPHIDTTFLMNFLQTDSFVKVVLDNCTGTSYPAINSNDLSNLDISLPDSKEEQRKIGGTITKLDHLITLHQRKCDEMSKLKKSMLQKMFPKNGEQFPEIRFSGFVAPWEQRKFGDENDLLTGYPFESDKFAEEGIKLVRGMNVKRGYLDFSNEICMRWNSSKGLENYLLEDGDILIQMDGALIGKSYARIDQNQLPALLVQRVTRARTNRSKADSDFMYQAIQNSFLAYIGLNKTETAVPHLSLTDIRNFKIMVPTLEEQNKIGGYLSSLDNLITLHQRKCEELKTIKKFMLQNMFPTKG